jgi:hypothetical protein
MVQLTEQEVFGIIQNQLENAGFEFDKLSNPPSVAITDVYNEFGSFGVAHTRRRTFENDIQMHLINEENGVGIVVIPNWGWHLTSPCTAEVRERITQRFLTTHNIVVHIVFGIDVWDELRKWDEEAQNYVIDDEIQAQAQESIENTITEQIQSFIDYLRRDGTID